LIRRKFLIDAGNTHGRLRPVHPPFRNHDAAPSGNQPFTIRAGRRGKIRGEIW
jgi:hypothetical protein